MPHEYLHRDKEFADLIRIVSVERSIDPPRPCRKRLLDHALPVRPATDGLVF